MNRTTLLVITVSLWAAAATLLVTAAFDIGAPLARAALFVQMVALVPTVYLIADHLLAEHRRKMLVQMCEVIGRADAERLALHVHRSA